MPSGKETRLLHLGEMEKLDKTLFRLEQGRSGGAGCGLLSLLRFLFGREPSAPSERKMARSSVPSSGSNEKGAQRGVVVCLLPPCSPPTLFYCETTSDMLASTAELRGLQSQFSQSHKTEK